MRDYTFAELDAIRPAIAEKALAAEFRGAPLLRVAERVLEIASGGLERRAPSTSSARTSACTSPSSAR